MNTTEDDKPLGLSSTAGLGAAHEVTIDGVRYVRAESQPADAAMRLLAHVYGSLWCEAYYDPLNDATRAFAQPLALQMQAANAILKFKA